ncbi:MAG: SAM-dependent methyltransferase [Pseudonocardia sp.]
MTESTAREIDVTKPSAARVYDLYLGGEHNYPVDRTFVQQAVQICPFVPDMARHNRGFLRRAVQFAVGQGVRQFIDIGSGVPTVGNVHEVAHAVDPETRVVYVDNDTEAVVTAQDILRGSTVATAIPADLRNPEDILGHPDLNRLIDFDEPVALLIVAVFHFVSPDDDPHRLLGAYIDRLAPGSHVALSHITVDDATPVAREQLQNLEREYGNTSNPAYLRTREEFTRLFDGLELVEPGVAYAADWQSPEPIDGHDPARPCFYAAVGKKP